MGSYYAAHREARALRIAMETAERNERWSLLRGLLRFVADAGGSTTRLGPSDYLITYPKDQD